MRLLAIEDEGVTEYGISSSIDDLLEALKESCDGEYTIQKLLDELQTEAEVTLSLVDLVESGRLECDDLSGLREHKELAEDSLKTIEILRKRAGELGYL